MRVRLKKVISKWDSERYFHWSNHEGSRCFNPSLTHELSISLAYELKDRIEELYSVEECKLTGDILISCDFTLASVVELKAIYMHEKHKAKHFAINALSRSKAVMDDYGYIVISDKVLNEIKSELDDKFNGG